MAVLIPDVPKKCSRAERMVYERLGRELPDDWVILHSLGLPGHETKIWGEADIVVLSAKGFFALEVKGGQVSCSDGEWEFGEPGKKSYTRKEDPWTQAKGTMVAIMNRLCGADPAFNDMLFGYGVVMPMEPFRATGAEIIPEVLLNKDDFPKNMMRYVALLERYWQEDWEKKKDRTRRLPSVKDIRRARELLRPDVDSAYSIGSYLTGLDDSLLQLTNAQIRASRRMAANPRTIVRGPAGSGKTVLAVERARQLSDEGHRVLFLTFNHLLARHLAAGMTHEGRGGNVDVWHAHSLFREVIGKAGLAGELEKEEGSDHFFDQAFPRIFCDAVLELDFPCWDALVVDEAQDLLTPEYLDAFDLVLKEGLRRGNWHMFLDPLQNLYASDVQSAVDARMGESHPVFDDLWENCRNTKEVAIQTSIMSGMRNAMDGAAEGIPCENVYFTSAEDFLRKLETLVEKLVHHDVLLKDLIILSSRKLANSRLAGVSSLAGFPVADISTGETPPRLSLHFSTMHSFKGLERGVVIAIDMEEIGEEHFAMLHYAGLSRARGLLRTFISQPKQTRYNDLARIFGARLGDGPAV